MRQSSDAQRHGTRINRSCALAFGNGLSVVVVSVGAVYLESLVAIATFDKACVLRDCQPDTRMAQGTFAAVASNFPVSHNLGFWRLGGHVSSFDLLRPQFIL
jgi:hypothetical protein